MFCHHPALKWSACNAFLIKSQSIFWDFFFLFFFVNLAATLITSPAAVDPALCHSVWQPLTDANLLSLFLANGVTCRHDWHYDLSISLSSEALLDWSCFPSSKTGKRNVWNHSRQARQYGLFFIFTRNWFNKLLLSSPVHPNVFTCIQYIHTTVFILVWQ